MPAMAPALIKTAAGQWLASTYVFWDGDLSTVFVNGPLVRFLIEVFRTWPGWVYMPRSDGDIRDADVLADLAPYGAGEADLRAGRVWVCSVAQRFVPDLLLPSRLLLLPQDDGLFDRGIGACVAVGKPWAERAPRVFWRGACSGNGDFLRGEVVRALLEHPACDVRLTRRWHEGRDVPDTFFADPEPMARFMDHKYILVVDGNGISSSLSWVFGSGSVPVLVTNCNWWFKDELVPYKNYVPVAYDLSDLRSVIDWLLAHDAEAEAIAAGAMALAVRILSPTWQREYVRGVTRSV